MIEIAIATNMSSCCRDSWLSRSPLTPSDSGSILPSGDSLLPILPSGDSLASTHAISMEYIENLGIMMNLIILKFFKESNRTGNCPNFQLIYFQSSSPLFPEEDEKYIN